VRCFVRPAGNMKTLPAGRVEMVCGDLDNPDSLEAALEGVDALVNLASLGFGHAEGIIAAGSRGCNRMWMWELLLELSKQKRQGI